MRYYTYNQVTSETLVLLDETSTLTIEEWKAKQNR